MGELQVESDWNRAARYFLPFYREPNYQDSGIVTVGYCPAVPQIVARFTHNAR
jgi:hypothetical protein